MGRQDLLALLGYHVEARLDVFLVAHRKQNGNQWIRVSQKQILAQWRESLPTNKACPKLEWEFWWSCGVPIITDICALKRDRSCLEKSKLADKNKLNHIKELLEPLGLSSMVTRQLVWQKYTWFKTSVCTMHIPAFHSLSKERLPSYSPLLEYRALTWGMGLAGTNRRMCLDFCSQRHGNPHYCR